MQTSLDDFMTKAEGIGPHTLDDHLTLQGFVIDFNDRNAMKSAVTRALGNRNSPYHHLRGTIFFPTVGSRAAWGDGLTQRHDTLPRPSFTTSLVLQGSVGAVVERNDFISPATEVALRALMQATATLSNRRQERIGGGVTAIAGERDTMAHELRLATERYTKAEAQVEQLMAVVRSQLALMQPSASPAYTSGER